MRVDDKLRELSQQAFGSRIVIREKLDVDFDITAFDIDLDRLDDAELPFFRAVEFFNRPAKPDQIVGLITRMRVSLIRRNEENQDAEMLIDTLTDLCQLYPYDALVVVTNDWLAYKKFFPLPSEFLRELRKVIAFRKSLLHVCEEKRNPLLANVVQQRKIASDPRLAMGWKELPRSEWLPQHYEWAIAECSQMMKLAQANPTFLNVKMWEEKVQELEKAQIANAA